MPALARAARHLLAPALGGLLLVSVAGGCARPAPAPPPAGTPAEAVSDVPDAGRASDASDFPRSRRIAGDFVDALRASGAMSPATTTLYTAPPVSRFGEILLLALQEAGYEMRVGDASAGPALAYAAMPDARGDRYAFEIVVGDLRMTRSYRVDADGVEPLSPMRVVRAERPRPLVEDVSEFDARSAASSGSVGPGAAAAASSRALPSRRVPPSGGASGSAPSDEAERRRRRAAFLEGRLGRDLVDDETSASE